MSSVFERRIKVAAFHYAGGERDANRLADLAGVSVRSLYRVATDPGHRLYPVWHSELQALGCVVMGDVSFRTRAPGRQVDEVKRDAMRSAWQGMGPARRAGYSRNMLASKLAAEVQVSHGTAVGWIRGFEKEEEKT